MRDLRPRASFVQQVDGLVGQAPVRKISHASLTAACNALGDLHAVLFFKARLKAAKNLDRFLGGGLAHRNRLKPALRAGSFSMYLWYSAGVVAPMQRNSPRASGGLRMFAASMPIPTSV
jgi:hypothetical protein